MKRSFTPVFDRVLIKREDASILKRLEKSGLIASDQTKASYQSSEGVLVKVGDGCCEEIKDMLGKKILFAKYSGDDLTLNGEDFVLASEMDIFGRLDDE